MESCSLKLYTTLLELDCVVMLHSKVIFNSMTGPDDTFHIDLQA